MVEEMEDRRVRDIRFRAAKKGLTRSRGRCGCNDSFNFKIVIARSRFFARSGRPILFL